MSINGRSDQNSTNLSGVLARDAEQGTVQKNGNFWLAFTVLSELVIKGAVSHVEASRIIMYGDDAREWINKGNLKVGTYVYLTGLTKETKQRADADGNPAHQTVFKYSSYDRCTLVIDTNHEVNAGLIARPVDAVTNVPLTLAGSSELPWDDDEEVPAMAPTIAAQPTATDSDEIDFDNPPVRSTSTPAAPVVVPSGLPSTRTVGAIPGSAGASATSGRVPPPFSTGVRQRTNVVPTTDTVANPAPLPAPVAEPELVTASVIPTRVLRPPTPPTGLSKRLTAADIAAQGSVPDAEQDLAF